MSDFYFLFFYMWQNVIDSIGFKQIQKDPQYLLSNFRFFHNFFYLNTFQQRVKETYKYENKNNFSLTQFSFSIEYLYQNK